MAGAGNATQVSTQGELDLASMPTWQPNCSRSSRLPMQNGDAVKVTIFGPRTLTPRPMKKPGGKNPF